MDLDAYFAEHPSTASFGDVSDNPEFKSGFAALVGRPNSGKSTLVNRLLGKKVAITSDTSQTTRKRLSAVLTTDDFQIVFVDTPGIHKPKDVLGEELNATALNALSDVDVIAMLIDSTAPVGRGDEWVASQINKLDIPKVCVLTKQDLVSPEQVQAQWERASKLSEWSAVVSLSSKTGYNIDAFIEEIVSFLPKGPMWFPKDMQTDQDEEMLVAEFIREKILRSFEDEIPHSVGVLVDEMDYSEKKDLYRIFATIYTERESQKAILIGKGGRAIKAIGTSARHDLEHMLGCRVYLELSVKVKSGWRSDDAQLRKFGYSE